MKFGIQLYGIDKECKQCPAEWFQALKDFGYQIIEPCMTFYESNTVNGWSPDRFCDYADIAINKGFKIVSCHILSENPKEDTFKAVQILKEYQVSYLVWNIPKILTTQEGENFASACMEVADGLLKYDMKLLLHNGVDAIRDKIGGMSVFEWVLEHCEDKVYAEPDTGWIFAGGGDAEQFLWKNEKYIKLIHHKDFLQEGKECALGKGSVDLKSCFQFSRAKEIIQFVDQDESQGRMKDDVRQAADYLKSLCNIRENTKSILCILDTFTGEIKRLATFDKTVEAPNFLKDNDTLIYNSEGKIWKYSISENTREVIYTGHCDACNNDHVVSEDQEYIAVSHNENGMKDSRIYVLPIEGGEPKLVTEKAPSYMHGWSPDGKEIVYCAFREEDGKLAANIYTKPVAGGEERQMTKNQGFNDGPEYAPDGKAIWFISTRTGLMQVWKMDADGNNQQQMTFENRNNWFCHVSPDGKKVINLSYSAEGLEADEHLPNMNVELWIMDTDGNNREKLIEFFGGQGSINVNSWAQDNRHVALVIYELNHK